MARPFLSAAFAAASTLVSGAAVAEGGPVEGQPAPDFTAPGPGGRPVALSDYRGKVVVLYFYPKDDTPGCTIEAKSFRDAAAEFQALGAVVLGVSRDGLESHGKFAKKYDLAFPLVADEDGKVHDLYDAWKHNMFGHTVLGVDRSTFVIDREGIVRKVWRGVSPSAHVDEVLAFVRSIP